MKINATNFDILFQIVKNMSIPDLLDIILVAYLVYKLISLLRENRAGQLLKGVIGILLLYAISTWTQMRATSSIISFFITNVVFALLIVFQPELRKILEQFGRSNFTMSQLSKIITGMNKTTDSGEVSKLINALCDACAIMSKEHIGALIVIERNTKLGDIIATGTLVDANPSAELIKNVFFPNSPLHDGAMIIRNSRVHAAGCFLPLSNNYDISRTLGTRHRAALGISELTDALVIIVSEETGAISVAKSSRLNLRLTVNSLNTILQNELLDKDPEKRQTVLKSFFRRNNHENEQNNETE